MNFRICYGFQYVSKAIAFGLNTLVFVQTISYDLKTKNVSYYKWVIWISSHDKFWNSLELIEILLYFMTLCHGWPCSNRFVLEIYYSRIYAKYKSDQKYQSICFSSWNVKLIWLIKFNSVDLWSTNCFIIVHP